jgi:hypothetical protein
MAVVYEKTMDGKLKVSTTSVQERKHDLKQLKRQKQFLKAKLDEIQALIDECVKLGVEE